MPKIPKTPKTPKTKNELIQKIYNFQIKVNEIYEKYFNLKLIEDEDILSEPTIEINLDKILANFRASALPQSESTIHCLVYDTIDCAGCPLMKKGGCESNSQYDSTYAMIMNKIELSKRKRDIRNKKELLELSTSLFVDMKDFQK